MPVTRPNVHSTGPTINAGSTAHTLVTLPFWANYVRVRNAAGNGVLYVDYQGNAPSTADSASIAGGNNVVVGANQGIYIKEIGLHTTSTGAGGQKVSVLAMVGSGDLPSGV